MVVQCCSGHEWQVVHGRSSQQGWHLGHSARVSQELKERNSLHEEQTSCVLSIFEGETKEMKYRKQKLLEEASETPQGITVGPEFA